MVNAVKAVGFVITTLGLLVYNQLILRDQWQGKDEKSLLTEGDKL